jgi:hypothetical protein
MVLTSKGINLEVPGMKEMKVIFSFQNFYQNKKWLSAQLTISFSPSTPFKTYWPSSTFYYSPERHPQLLASDERGNCVLGGRGKEAMKGSSLWKYELISNDDSHYQAFLLYIHFLISDTKTSPN